MSDGSAIRRRIGCDDEGQPLCGRIDDRCRFHLRFRAHDTDIDELGHVNNATWVSWIQDASVAHWLRAARSEDRDRFAAVVVRHEVDYRGNIRSGDEIAAVTWVSGAPRGARYARRVEFAGADGRTLVSSLSQWALIDRQTGKLVRVPPEVAAPFLHDDAA
ncbi:MAG TPA: acyl-CoA thioesterase [Tardiphaga sp.]